ncbi:MAG: glycosyltransferase family 2 protein, partial [Muribaculaceae bacterium]|nr:glycosyltransferase family 2 protein [Muribaculaceae bacterium]
MEYIFGIFDGIIACFTANLSWEYLVTTYWFLIFIEFPRYYLTDIIAVARYGATWRSRRKAEAMARRALFTERPLVTVMAPGKNEGKNLYHLLESLREQTYNNFEIIIVDDGSDDATPFICSDLQKAGLIKHYFRMTDRGGKASAANCGLEHAKGKYLVHIDADSSLDRDAIEQILLPFYLDRDVRGVGGCIKVRNADDSMCSSMQALEYLRTIQVGRMATDMMGIFHIISGAFGAF